MSRRIYVFWDVPFMSSGMCLLCLMGCVFISSGRVFYVFWDVFYVFWDVSFVFWDVPLMSSGMSFMPSGMWLLSLDSCFPTFRRNVLSLTVLVKVYK